MEGGRTAAAAAAPGAAGGAPPPTAGEQPRFFLRLEYISERTTRVVLAAQRVGMLVCLAILILLVLAQVRKQRVPAVWPSTRMRAEQQAAPTW